MSGCKKQNVIQVKFSIQTPQRYLNRKAPGPTPSDVQQVSAAIKRSRKIVFMFGRVNRSQKCWDERIQLAELVHACVVTDIKQHAAFPTTHELHTAAPALFLNPSAKELITDADLIVAWEWVDLAGSLASASDASTEAKAKVIQISLDSTLHNGWSKDHFGQAPADIDVHSDADEFLTELLSTLQADSPTIESTWPPPTPSSSLRTPITDDNPIFMSDLASALYAAIPPSQCCLIRVPLSFPGTHLITSHPLSFMGYDGGAGVGSGPGIAVGCALALKSPSSPDLLPVAIFGDGDYLMGSSALWTAAHYHIPLLIIVANNASYYNDEVHQERVAKTRNRLVRNKWIGMRIDEPLPDLSKNAESLGVYSPWAQVKSRRELSDRLDAAVASVRQRKGPVLLDVKVLPDDYGKSFDGDSVKKH